MRIVKPNRASHSYRQRLLGTPATIFPLLCPVREAEWASGWNPDLVITASGVAEADAVFVTPAKPSPAVWYITRYEPENWFIEFLKITPDVTACRIQIQLNANGAETFADITYMHTSLGAAGDEFVAGFTVEFYRRFMQDWEIELNRFLQR